MPSKLSALGHDGMGNALGMNATQVKVSSDLNQGRQQGKARQLPEEQGWQMKSFLISSAIL